jgi:hypothetical protein
MPSEHLYDSLYVWAMAIGAIGIILIVVSLTMQKSQSPLAGRLKFAGFACAALAIIMATSTFFVSSGVNRPLHIEHGESK